MSIKEIEFLDSFDKIVGPPFPMDCHITSRGATRLKGLKNQDNKPVNHP